MSVEQQAARFKKLLAAYEEAAESLLQRFVDDVQEALVNPLLAQKGATLRCGQGTYWCSLRDEDVEYGDEENLLLHILEAQVFGMGHYPLGSHMNDFTDDTNNTNNDEDE